MVLSLRSPQKWLEPAVTALKVPPDASVRSNAASRTSPQQVMVSSLRSAQDTVLGPASIAFRLLPGASLWPFALEPQQVMVSSLRSPQECHLPAVTALKLPVGASD